MKTFKAAVFIHGWAGSRSNWTVLGKPVQRVFKKRGYGCLTPSLPGRFMSSGRNFDWYADWLKGYLEAKCSGAEEIVLVGYSMGGIVARNLLKCGREGKFGEWETWRKVRKVVTIASPHHGTETELMEIAEEALVKIERVTDFQRKLGFDKTLTQKLERLVKKISSCPCYLEVKPGSSFLEELNSGDNGTEVFEGVDFYTIRIAGDKVVTPCESGILKGAVENYLVDTKRVGHVGVRLLPEVKRVLEGMVEGW